MCAVGVWKVGQRDVTVCTALHANLCALQSWRLLLSSFSAGGCHSLYRIAAGTPIHQHSQHLATGDKAVALPAADGFGGYAVLAGLAAVGASLLPVIGPILEVSVPP